MLSQTETALFAGSRSRMTVRALARTVLIATIAFLTVADLFATQAILPMLVHAYGVSPARMSFAVNASTIGMAIASLGMALFGHRIPRRFGVIAALALLAVPTLLLSGMPDLPVFTVLRILQGLCMATAFVLTLAWLAETSAPGEAALAFAPISPAMSPATCSAA